jgi:DNA-binding protein HU-beta
MAAKAMTKTQVINHLAEYAQLSKKATAGFLEEYAGLAVRETKKNGQFVLPGLGKLVKSHRKARKGRNPQTGETINISARTVVKFRVAKACKDAVVPPKK